jgi:hypothetical protein
MGHRKTQLVFNNHPVTCPHRRTDLVFTSREEVIVLGSRTCPKCGKEFVIENGKGVKAAARKGRVPTANFLSFVFDVEPCVLELEYRLFDSGRQSFPLQKNRERWMELAELAANEQDSNKLLEIIKEINLLLSQKQERLAHLPPKPDPKLPDR